MKRIRLWVVILLNIVTLGIYSFVWLIKRRGEMVRVYKQEVPPWWWLILPASVAMAATLMLFVAAATSNQNSVLGAMVGVLFALMLASAIAIQIWWLWRFSKAAAYATNGKVPAEWSLLLYWITGMFFSAFLQYYFNRAEPAKKLEGKPPAQPSRRFITLALVVVMILFVVPFIAGAVMGYYNAGYNARHYLEEAERLNKEYRNCIDMLGEDYPVVTSQNELAYSAAYDRCEDIRLEQYKAVERYNEF